MRWSIISSVLVATSWAAASQNPLVDAIKNQDHKQIATLMAGRPNVNESLPDGSTALAWAAYEDDTATARQLLAAGAKVDTTDEYGESPLTIACAMGNPQLVSEFLQRGANANSSRHYGETALMIAAASGDREVVRLLIDHGADIHAAEQQRGQTALMWAAAKGKPDAVDLLLKAGARVDALSKGGFSPVLFAVERGDALSTERLLVGGANLNALLPDKSTVLLVGLTLKKSRAAAVLIEHGANITVRDRAGNTPLHLAATFGDLNNVKLLASKGADLNAKTNSVALRRGGGGNFRRLTGEQTPLMLAARANRVDVMRALAAAGADPKLLAQDGSNLLMAAAASGRPEAVEYAYDLAPYVKALNETKASVMHAAVNGTSLVAKETEICEVIQFLSDKGADVNLADANGRTPLSIAKAVPMEKAAALLSKLMVVSTTAPTGTTTSTPSHLSR